MFTCDVLKCLCMCEVNAEVLIFMLYMCVGICAQALSWAHSIFSLPLQGTFLVLGLVRIVVILVCLLVFVNVCQCLSDLMFPRSIYYCQGCSWTMCVCESVCMWVCDSSCMLPLYTQQEIVCAHVFICLCAHASKQFLHYGHSHTIKCNNICKTNDQQMLLKWQACIEIWENPWDFDEYYFDTIVSK